MNVFYSAILMICFSAQTSFCQSLGWANYECKSWRVSVKKVQLKKIESNTLSNTDTCDTVTETKEVGLGNPISLYPNTRNCICQLESHTQLDVKIRDLDGILVLEYKNIIWRECKGWNLLS